MEGSEREREQIRLLERHQSLNFSWLVVNAVSYYIHHIKRTKLVCPLFY